MSDLRTQLQLARDEYTAIKYPGNLVADLAKLRAGSSMRWVLPIGGAMAAAAIAVVIWLRPATPVTPEHGGTHTEVATNNVDDAVEQFVPAPVSMPADVVPSIPTATMAMPMISVPSVPSIPTWSVSTDVSLEESSSIQG
jgi:hypothetical protein